MKKALHEEITAALEEGALDVFTEADLAADALDLAEAEAQVRRPALPWKRHARTAAAILLASLGIWALMPASDPVRDPMDEHASGSVAAEREKNLELYRSAAVRRQLAALPKGTYVGIAGGVTVVHSDSLHGVDKALDEAQPHARHRFVFLAGTEGDVAHTTNFGRPPFAGAAFINELGLGLGMGGGKVRYWRDDPQRGRLQLEVPLREGRGAEMPLYVGSPDGMERVPALVGYSTGSTNPLVLPPGVGFPRFEIPGTARLEGGSDHPGAFRRYMASISIPQLGIHELDVEAMGTFDSLVGDDGALVLGVQRFVPLDEDVRVRAREAGRPLLALERFPWLQRFPGNPFEGLEREALLAEAVATFHYVLAWKQAERGETWAGRGDQAPPAHTVLSVFGPDGEPRGRLVVTQLTKVGQIAALLAGVRYGPSPGGTSREQAVQRAELLAVGALRHWATAQAHVRALGAIDADHDGVGEFAGIAELVGAPTGRLPQALAEPPVRDGDFSERRDGAVLAYGYWFRIFLPGADGLGVREGTDGFPRGAVDPDQAERSWCAYAWPATYRDSGIRTFFVNQQGEVWATDGAYSGTDGDPPSDAALAAPGPITGGVSPALVSVDGNRWQRLAEVSAPHLVPPRRER